MGFLDSLCDFLDGVTEGLDYIDFLSKYEFSDFDDVIRCCDALNKEIDEMTDENAGNIVTRVDLMTDSLSKLYSERKIKAAFLIEIYGYCRGMLYVVLQGSLDVLLSDLNIEH